MKLTIRIRNTEIRRMMILYLIMFSIGIKRKIGINAFMTTNDLITTSTLGIIIAVLSISRINNSKNATVTEVATEVPILVIKNVSLQGNNSFDIPE